MNGAIPLLPVVLGDIIVTYIQYFHFSLIIHLIPWLFASYLIILVLFGTVHSAV